MKAQRREMSCGGKSKCSVKNAVTQKKSGGDGARPIGNAVAMRPKKVGPKKISGAVTGPR